MRLKETEDKIRSTQAFCEITKYLLFNPLAPVVKGQDTQEQLDRHRLQKNIVAHMLCAILVENTIKILWELEHNQECEYSHNVQNIYNELGNLTRTEIRNMYDKQTTAFAAIEGTMEGKAVKLGDIVQLASFEQALQSNAATMRNFKYDNKFQGKTSVFANAIWDQDTIWTLPSGHKPFAVSLFEYMMDCV